MYDIVKNPIPRNGLWATPTLEQISDQIEVFPPEQKAQMHNGSSNCNERIGSSAIL